MAAPLVANDMHLAVRVPNTWYRASLEWPLGDARGRPEPSSPSGSLRLIGITLPGAPALVVGSNTHVAWGFTNTYADWSDLILLDVDPQDPTRYRTPDGWRNFDRYDEVIEVAGGPAEHLPVSWTIWGPVLEPDFHGRPRAMRWVAHDADRLAVISAALEKARTVDETFDAVNGLGAPGQNFVVADAQGHIGWTVYGSIPRRVGFDGRLPQSWADGYARVERLADPGRVSARARSGERTPLDGERPRRGRRHAERARLRQLRGRLAGAHHPRSAHGQRTVRALRPARHTARHAARRSWLAGAISPCVR